MPHLFKGLSAAVTNGTMTKQKPAVGCKWQRVRGVLFDLALWRKGEREESLTLPGNAGSNRVHGKRRHFKR